MPNRTTDDGRTMAVLSEAVRLRVAANLDDHDTVADSVRRLHRLTATFPRLEYRHAS